MDKLMSQRLLFQQKKEDALKKIRDLGALPQEAFEKYRDATQKQLFDKLDKTRAALKKYAGVNKKAADQYANFTEQREDLVKRKKGQSNELYELSSIHERMLTRTLCSLRTLFFSELTDGRTSIVDLIAHLDAKKDEAIERTFKTIAKHFSEVFQELVPGGKAMLVMETEKVSQAMFRQRRFCWLANSCVLLLLASPLVRSTVRVACTRVATTTRTTVRSARRLPRRSRSAHRSVRVTTTRLAHRARRTRVSR
jgi:chromosome segregation ATPase